jgi:hypothetical protein
LPENHLVRRPDCLINLLAEQPEAQMPIRIFQGLGCQLVAMRDNPHRVLELGPVPKHTDAEPDDGAQDKAREESNAPLGAMKVFLLTPRQPSTAPD